MDESRCNEALALLREFHEAHAVGLCDEFSVVVGGPRLGRVRFDNVWACALLNHEYKRITGFDPQSSLIGLLKKEALARHPGAERFHIYTGNGEESQMLLAIVPVYGSSANRDRDPATHQALVEMRDEHVEDIGHG